MKPAAQLLAPVLAFVLVMLSGCVYSKHVTNEHVRLLDAGRIVVGETTVLDVLHSWGPPAPLAPTELVRAAAPSLFSLTSRQYRYVSREVKCTAFALMIPPKSRRTASLPFGWCDDQPAYALVVEFDGQGVVSRVTRGSSEVVWRPWRRVASRSVSVETISTPGGTLP